MTTAQRINPATLRESGDAAVLTAEAQPAPAAAPSSRRMPIAMIRLDGGTQPRAAINQGHINELADDLRAGATLPPIDVMYDGGAYWLFDGYHRLHAHKLAYGESASIDVRIHQGSLADAQWASFAVNKAHGLRRTTEDKQRAITAALKHPNGASRSNREIGRHLGVDDKTVGEWRKKLESAAEIPQVTERQGADGKVYSTANIGANRPNGMAAGTPDARRLTAEIKAATWGDRNAGATGALPKLEVPLRMAGAVEQERATWGDLVAIVREVAKANGPFPTVMRQAADMRSTHQKNKFYYDVLNAVRGRFYNRFDLADMCMAISTVADEVEAAQPVVHDAVQRSQEAVAAYNDAQAAEEDEPTLVLPPHLSGWKICGDGEGWYLADGRGRTTETSPDLTELIAEAERMDEAAEPTEEDAFAAAPLPKAIPAAALTARQAADLLREQAPGFYEDGSSTWMRHASADMRRNAQNHDGAFWRTCVDALTWQGYAQGARYTPALLRQAIELLADELTPAEQEVPVPADVPAAQDDDRKRRLESYLWHIEYMLNSLDAWAELTGHSVDTLEALRGLRKMRDITKREIAILNGEAVPADHP